MAQQNRNRKRGAKHNPRGTEAQRNGDSASAASASAAKRSATPLIIGLGASAGGLDAFKTFFSGMPPHSGFAFVLVQHLDPQHKGLLSEVLGKQTEMPVTQAEDGTAVAADHVFVIPPNAVLTISDGILHVATPARPRDRRRPIDTFFISLAEDQGENAVGIILSGSDGTAGLQAIKEHGGLTLAQGGVDETALPGMPSSAAAIGLVDYVMPVEAMPEKLLDCGHHPGRVVEHKDHDGTRRDDVAAVLSAIVRPGGSGAVTGTDAAHSSTFQDRGPINGGEARSGTAEPGAKAQALDRELHAVLAAIVESSDDAIISKDLDGIIATWNKGAQELFGYTAEEAVGQSIRMLLPPDRSEEEDEILARIRRGERIDHHETVRRRKDGSPVDISLTVSLIKDAGGRIIGASTVARDITERRHAEAFRTLMVDELNHRVKNTLATVQSIAAQSLRGADVNPGVREVFESRLLALSKAHDLLTRGNWDGASLRELLSGELDPYRSRDRARVAVEGPDVTLPPKASIALAMAFHELATNAAKHGALSNESGKVAVSWNVDDAPSKVLRLKWVESDGPPVRPPRRRGFGSRLIERGLSLELNGHARLEFEPPGVVCIIEMPVPRGDERVISNVR